MLWRSLWLALPVVAGGLAHVAVIKANLWPSLARIPLDARQRLRGRRLFGVNKSVRGALVMIAATTGFAVLQSSMATHLAWARALTFPALDHVSPVAWGMLLGAGYVLGELPNSVVKRQLDIAPGARASGSLAPVFWVVDQIDSLLGIFMLMPLLWTPPLIVGVWLIVITLAVHPLVALVMFTLGLKRRVG